MKVTNIFQMNANTLYVYNVCIQNNVFILWVSGNKMSPKLCVCTSLTSSFQQTLWSNREREREGEGVTQGMSLKGSQTGNTSGCCQDVFVRLRMCACEYIYSKLNPEHNHAEMTNKEHKNWSKYMTHAVHVFIIFFPPTYKFKNRVPVWIHFTIFLLWGSVINSVSTISVTDPWPSILHSGLKVFLPDNLRKICRYVASLCMRLHGWIWQCCRSCTVFQVKDTISSEDLISSQEYRWYECEGEDISIQASFHIHIHTR